MRGAAAIVTLVALAILGGIMGPASSDPITILRSRTNTCSATRATPQARWECWHRAWVDYRRATRP